MHYAVSLDLARVGTRINTQGLWPCEKTLDSLPLLQQQLAKSPDLMSNLRKMTRRHMVAGWIHLLPCDKCDVSC